MILVGIVSGYHLLGMHPRWRLCGLYVDSVWTLYGLYMDFMWTLYGLYVVSTWTLCGCKVGTGGR